MANPVKAWRTVDAGSAQSLHEVVQTPLELALAQPAAHRDEALALVSADALVRRLCDGPGGVREDVPRVDPAPAAGSTAASLQGALLLPTEWVVARHATSMSVANQVHRRSPSVLSGTVCRRLDKPGVGGSSPPESARYSTGNTVTRASSSWDASTAPVMIEPTKRLMPV